MTIPSDLFIRCMMMHVLISSMVNDVSIIHAGDGGTDADIVWTVYIFYAIRKEHDEMPFVIEVGFDDIFVVEPRRERLHKIRQLTCFH